MPTAADPVGLAEIAERLGVQPNTAHAWNKRGLLPEPRWRLAIGPVWDWRDVEAWARETQRL